MMELFHFSLALYSIDRLQALQSELGRSIITRLHVFIIIVVNQNFFLLRTHIYIG